MDETTPDDVKTQSSPEVTTTEDGTTEPTPEVTTTEDGTTLPTPEVTTDNVATQINNGVSTTITEYYTLNFSSCVCAVSYTHLTLPTICSV